jgi:hypothetical protein
VPSPLANPSEGSAAVAATQPFPQEPALQPAPSESNPWMHVGGIAGVPRFHTGFADLGYGFAGLGMGLGSIGFGNFFSNDEILAVLQRGERIFSRDDTEELEDTVSRTAAGIVNREALRAGDRANVMIQHTINVLGNADDRVLKKIRDYLESDYYQKAFVDKVIDSIEREWNKDMIRHKVR